MNGGRDGATLDAVSGAFHTPSGIVINGFQPGVGGTKLGVVQLLQSVFPDYPTSSPPPSGTDSWAAGHLRLIASGPDTLLQIDPSGTGSWSTLVTLAHVDPFALITPYNFDLPVSSNDWFPPITGNAAAVQTGVPNAQNTLNGGPGPDALTGGYRNDTFHGGSGSDHIAGNGGLDTSVYDGAYRQYTVKTGAPGDSSVTGGPEGGTDNLLEISRLQFADGYLAILPGDAAGQVYRVYEATLGRAPDQEGLTNWVNSLNSGTSLQAVVDGFVGSAEFQATYGANLSNAAFVTLLYHNVLHREPDEAGLNNWVGLLSSGQDTRAQVVTGFSESLEDINALAAPVEQGLWVGNPDAAKVARFYDTVFSRLPDGSGLANWTNMLKGGMSLQTVANGFVGSAEFQATYGSLNNTDFVTLLYHNVLHRDPDMAGLNNWVGMLGSGQETRAQVVVGFSESAEHIANTAPHIDGGVWLT